jgi:inorganic pyrophosphatase
MTINAIIIAKRKNQDYKIKFATDFKSRMKKYSNLTDFDRFNFVELPKTMSKLEALQFVVNESVFNYDEAQKIIKEKISRYETKLKSSEYKLMLTNTKVFKDLTPEQLLDAIK